MRKRALVLFLVLGLGLGLSPGLVSPSFALVEVGAGIGSVSFADDYDFIDSDIGTSLEANIGSGVLRLMISLQDSSHDLGDYQAIMAGPSWILEMGGFSGRIYVMVSSHEFEDSDGTGVTAGGGLGWPIFPAASLGFDLRSSVWEGDGGADVRTDTIQLLFRIGF